MSEARDLVLEHFKKLEGFKLEKQMQAELAGLNAMRLECAWKDSAGGHGGIVYLLEQPVWYNVIYYVAPAENGIFEESLPVFQKVMRSLKPLESGAVSGIERSGAEQRLRSPELGIEFSFPVDWILELDKEKRTLVLSGPRQKRDWLSTINFALVHKWPES